MNVHAPTPWKTFGELSFCGSDGQIIGTVFTAREGWHISVAIAADIRSAIIDAVNERAALQAQRDELLAACRVGFDVALRFHDEAAADILTSAIAHAKAGGE